MRCLGASAPRAAGAGGTRRRRAGVIGAALLAAAALTAALPPLARAASPATVTTGAAHEVGYASAVLTGSLNPKGSDTSYYFQYGVTRAYGGQSAIADAGAGTQTVKVALAVTGLQPLSIYHYRLVAVNAAGASLGADDTLLTTKVPLSLAILASPNPVAFGDPVLVQGTLSGTGNAGRVVILQSQAFPFTGPFQNLGNPEVTSATGSFAFPILGLAASTVYRVLTTSNPPVISPVVQESVAVRVSSHVARTRRRGFARIYGTVTPAVDGQQVGILRISHGRGVLVGGTFLRHRSTAASSFSRIVPVRRGVYRVLVRVIGAAQVSSYGQPLLIG